MPITIEPLCPPETTIDLPSQDENWSTKSPGFESMTINGNGTSAASLRDTELDQILWTETSYPSNCLRFLQDIRPSDEVKSACAVPRQARIKLKIIIVGAGLGGLATATALARRGHKVTVFEQAEQLAEVGAGIQIPPNSGKLLQRWGVIDELADRAVQPDGISFRRWESGALIGFTDLTGPFVKSFESPYYVAHRAHLHSALVKRATTLGVELLLKSKVIEYDPEAPSITLGSGEIYDGDLVIAADGIKSIARQHVSRGHRSKPKATGYAVYRATVDTARMRDIPDISWLLEKPALNIWIGEDKHVMTYTIAAGQAFNMVLSHKDNRDPKTWQQMPQKEILAEMKKQFEGWDDCLTRTISLIEHALKWPIMGNNSLRTWYSSSSRLVVLGDAAHAMVPYMSQGAAMAVEDGAALAVALNDIDDENELNFALQTFERERKTRTSMMQEASMVNSMIWHFPDGPTQQARDAAMLPEVEGRSFQSSPNQWSDPLTQSWAYHYDAEKKMEQEWRKAVHMAILGKNL